MDRTESPEREAPKLLLVDDDETLLSFLKQGLELHGYRVTACPSGAEAINRALGHPWDLIISDYLMPGADGRTLFQVIASVNPDLAHRMIFITGVSFEREVIDFLADSKCVFLRKPLKIDELIEAIERNLPH